MIKRRGPSTRKVERMTIQQKEALEDFYQLKQCIPSNCEIKEISKMIGIANRPLYKWFWKRNKQINKKVQQKDGAEKATKACDTGAMEG